MPAGGRRSPSSTIRVNTYGWVLEEGERHPFAEWGGPRPEVG